MGHEVAIFPYRTINRGVTWETYLKRKEWYYKNKEHFERIENFFTLLDKGFIKHVTTIFNYL